MPPSPRLMRFPFALRLKSNRRLSRKLVQRLLYFTGNGAPQGKVLIFLEMYPVEVARTNDLSRIEEMAVAKPRLFTIELS